MTIKKSSDGGKSWKGQYIVYEGNSGYSDLVELSDSQIALIYEGGEKDIQMDWLLKLSV